MKIQSIILICIIVINQKVDGNNNNGKLSVEENMKRLETCGREFLPQNSTNEHGKITHYMENPMWLLHTILKNDSLIPYTRDGISTDQQTYIHATAFPISKRHVITSSQVVLTEDKKWIETEEKLNESTCVSEKGSQLGYVDLPKNIVNSIFVWSGSLEKVSVLKGRVYRACGYKDFNAMFSPLLLEVEKLPSTTLNIPCLADETVPAETGIDLDAYGFDRWEKPEKKDVMQHHLVQVIGHPAKDWVYTTNYITRPDRGGPLVLNYTGKATVIGMKASIPADPKPEHGVYFYSMMNMYTEICDYTGVCKAPPTTRMAPTTTPDPSITTKKSPEKVTRKPEEDEDEMISDGKVEYVDADYKVGMEFYIDSDQYNGSMRRRMNFLELLIISFVLILMVLGR